MVDSYTGTHQHSIAPIEGQGTSYAVQRYSVSVCCITHITLRSLKLTDNDPNGNPSFDRLGFCKPESMRIWINILLDQCINFVFANFFSQLQAKAVNVMKPVHCYPRR